MELTDCNNRAELMGVIESAPCFSHEIYGEAFYLFILCVPRLSGVSDHIRIIVSERILADCELEIGDSVCIYGQFRSYNACDNGTKQTYPERFCARYNPCRRGGGDEKSQPALLKRLCV